MELLQKVEINFLQNLQEKFSNHEELILAISHLGDPRNAFLVYFPLAFCFISVRSGVQLLWVAVISDWLNAMLKWLLAGQRPYWWVMEDPIYTGEERPFLKQFRLTCETGPGCPSGHAMVTTAVWYILISSINEVMRSDAPSGHAPYVNTMTRLGWLLWILVALVVSVSRVFIATHFPHQVILGILIGALLGAMVRRYPVESFGFGTYFRGALFVVCSVFVEYSALSFLDLNPDWSLKLALKHCVYREWIHMDTTPFFAISRDVGAFFFLGMICSCLTLDYNPVKGGTIGKLCASLLTLAAAQVIESIYLPRQYVVLFYMLGSLKYGLVSMTTVGLNQAVVKFGGRSQHS